MEMSGLDGAMMTACASPIASMTPGAGAAACAPSKRMPTTSSAWRWRT